MCVSYVCGVYVHHAPVFVFTTVENNTHAAAEYTGACNIYTMHTDTCSDVRQIRYYGWSVLGGCSCVLFAHQYGRCGRMVSLAAPAAVVVSQKSNVHIHIRVALSSYPV